MHKVFFFAGSLALANTSNLVPTMIMGTGYRLHLPLSSWFSHLAYNFVTICFNASPLVYYMGSRHSWMCSLTALIQKRSESIALPGLDKSTAITMQVLVICL